MIDSNKITTTLTIDDQYVDTYLVAPEQIYATNDIIIELDGREVKRKVVEVTKTYYKSQMIRADIKMETLDD